MNCIPFLKALLSNSMTLESECILPRMEVLDLGNAVNANSSLRLELVEGLLRLASQRLNDPKVANLRSITISVTSAVDSDFDGSKIGQVWSECCDNALRLLVPEVNIVATATKSKPFSGDNSKYPHYYTPNLYNPFHHNPGTLLYNINLPTYPHAPGY